jgi:molecular chaperone HtpG
MKIPTKFVDLLQKDDSLHSSVLSVLATVTWWFEDNKLPFFPEYTDHGPRHVQEVLETAQALISKDSWSVLTTEDAATLIVAILLHDCAMHLTEDGFIHLITSEHRTLEGFGDRPWGQLWRDFIAEAKRFDDRKLKSLFDDTEPVKVPPLDPLQMTKRDHLLIGEFLRRHHPRLAHEIALTGIPGSKQRVFLGTLPDHIAKLAGIIARSHGIPLRTAVDHLNARSKWGARRMTGVHVTYLMTLVRVADYLQIHSKRAPSELLEVRSLRSPVSRGEWSTHKAVRDIHQETDDPEAIWVETDPTDVQTYLKLKALLTDIQREVDDCWAVLGEVYAPNEELRRLGLTIRRIKSNLDDTEIFARSVPFVPYPAALETSGAELLKLLISPLYGNNPEIGIRELLQNAVDACRELEDFLSQRPGGPTPDLPTQTADVVITVERKADGTKWVHISDCGIGMSINTILNYYLKAGASFRNSDAWKTQHEDEQGKPRVLRSGRFGIGVLAGFLLGDEIRVSTRHVTTRSDEGVIFTCRLENDVIEMNRLERPVGTTISIQLKDTAYSSLVDSKQNRWEHESDYAKWDWYCLETPSVARVLLPKGDQLKQRFVIPSEASSLPPTWRRLPFPDYDDIHWSYIANAPQLVCNGIIIEARGFLQNKLGQFGAPVLSIFDSRGTLPLNLQRTSLTVEELGFEKALKWEVHRDFLAYLLVNAPNKAPTANGALESYRRLSYPGLNSSLWYWCAPEGLSLLSPWHFKQLGVSRLIYVMLDEAPHLKRMTRKGARCCVVPVPVNSRRSENTIATLMGISRYDRERSYFDRNDNVQPTGTRIIGRRYEIEQLRGKLSERSNRSYDEDDWSSRDETKEYESLGRFVDESLTKTWAILCDSPEHLKEDAELLSPFELPEKDLASLLVSYIDVKNPGTDDSITSAWKRIIGSAYIPYSISSRKRLLSKAYKELGPYIKCWMEMKT